MYKCPHCNSVLPAHTATCPSMAEDVRLVLREECQKRIAELQANLEECRSVSTHWHGHTVRLKAENERIGNTLHAEEVKNYVLEAENERLRKGSKDRG